MACSDEWLEILSAWHDGEAASDEVARARQHVSRCGACQATLRGFERLRTALRALPEEAPARPAPRAGARPRRGWARAGAGALAAAAALALLFWVSPLHRTGASLRDELEAHHLRAFSRASPCEFESSDAGAVKAWVQAHVGYGVDVPSIPGARLLGARRCKLRGVLTASLLYRRGDEALTVFLPRAGTPAEAETVRLAASPSTCTVARLGDHVCARPGRFAVAETTPTALAALESS